MLMCWTRDQRDVVGLWSWGQPRFWGMPTWRTKIYPFLRDTAKKTWNEIDREMTTGRRNSAAKRHKSYPVGEIAKEAQDRLRDISLDDLDEVFRFRLASTERLYGFVIQHMFFVIWWDPYHNICPSDIQDRGKQRRG